EDDEGHPFFVCDVGGGEIPETADNGREDRRYLVQNVVHRPKMSVLLLVPIHICNLCHGCLVSTYGKSDSLRHRLQVPFPAETLQGAARLAAGARAAGLFAIGVRVRFARPVRAVQAAPAIPGRST